MIDLNAPNIPIIGAKKDDGKQVIRSIDTTIIKLKDRNNKHFVPIQLEDQFGFVPKIIVIEKVRGKNNAFIVRAILTEEMYKKLNPEKAVVKNEVV